MVLTSAISVGGQLLKRSFDDNNGFGFGSSAYQGNNPPPTTNEPLPVLAQVQVLINFLLFLPLLLYISYTLSSIFPTLAAIEDPLPAYEAIPIADPSFQPPQQVGKADNKKSSSPAINLNADLESSSASSSSAAVYRLAPITSSLRRTHRLLTSLNASSRFTFIRSCFRGLPFALISQIPAIIVALPLTQLTQLPRLIHLFVLLIFTHLNTAWVHIVITPPSSVRSWRRIPPFRRTLVATYIPVLFFWAALHSSAVIPYIISMPFLTPKDPEQPRTPAQQLTIALVSLIASVASLVSLLPAQVALLRVQASLLPEDQETIVPFDRSFGGRVAPQIVTGKGFPGVKAALASVTWPSWKRIIWQQVKLVGASGVLIFGVVLVAGLQVLVWKH